MLDKIFMKAKLMTYIELCTNKLSINNLFIFYLKGYLLIPGMTSSILTKFNGSSNTHSISKHTHFSPINKNYFQVKVRTI